MKQTKIHGINKCLIGLECKYEIFNRDLKKLLQCLEIILLKYFFVQYEFCCSNLLQYCKHMHIKFNEESTRTKNKFWKVY